MTPFRPAGPHPWDLPSSPLIMVCCLPPFLPNQLWSFDRNLIRKQLNLLCPLFSPVSNVDHVSLAPRSNSTVLSFPTGTSDKCRGNQAFKVSPLAFNLFPCSQLFFFEFFLWKLLLCSKAIFVPDGLFSPRSRFPSGRSLRFGISTVDSWL